MNAKTLRILTTMLAISASSLVAWGQESSPDGWFPFEPDRDDFSKSLFDLRSLNEPEAGAEGRVMAKGDDFVLPKSGRRIRFWGVCMGGEMMTMDHAALDYFARRMAKVGVNLVRFHTPNMLQQQTDQADSTSSATRSSFKVLGKMYTA
jgi:hypothetical protein